MYLLGYIFPYVGFTCNTDSNEIHVNSPDLSSHMIILSREFSLIVITIWSYPHSWLISEFVTRATRRVHMWSRNCLPFRSTWVPSVVNGVRVTRSLVFSVMFCILLLVLLSFFFWLLCCLSFFELRLLINPLVSSNL